MLVVASFFCYKALGSDLLPAMDEGGFVLDYITPAGTSLDETNRMIGHIEQMLQQVPGGGKLLAAHRLATGPGGGDRSQHRRHCGEAEEQAQPQRGRGHLRSLRTRIKQQEPAVDVEFIQVLQDMIGDLSNAPEPIQIKLFSPDAALLAEWAPRVGDAISKVPGVVDMLNGIENTISGPATVFQVNPAVAARAGFTPEEVAIDASAILEGEPAATPVIAQDIAYTIRVRYPDRQSQLAGGNEQHAAQQRDRTYRNAGHAGERHPIAGPDGDSPREPAARRRGDRSPGGTRLGQRGCGSAESG